MVRALVLTFLLGGAAVAEPPKRPPCTAALQSSFWPADANADPKLARQYAQQGVLEICEMGWMRYRWRAVTVNAKRAAAQAGQRRLKRRAD